MLLGIMAVLTSAGMKLENVIAHMASGDENDSQFAKDLRWVMSRVALGIDMINALKMLEERSVGAYRKFLAGLIDAYRIGNVTEYILNTADIQMSEKRGRIQKSIESMNILGEMYIVMMIVSPIL
ncbi:MAG: type II secretion system F family protein, partial [Candidatus Nitrosocaldus sp.]|nr:type II secretion system F family protein [Candidatus Nitrosocaldus sp.]